METGKHNLNIEELFRQKLENSEVIPGDRVKSDLMRKLARKEFLRFNPSRFNVYYLGIITAGAVIAGLLLLSDPEPRKSEPQNQPQKEQPAVRNDVTSGIQPANTVRETRKQVRIHNSASKGTVAKTETLPQTEEPAIREEATIGPAEVNSQISKSIALSETGRQKGLQSGPSSSPALFEPSAFSGCAPLKVHFKNLAGSYSSYKWTFGDGGFSDKREPEWIFDVEGEFKVVLNVTDVNGKTSTWSVPIRVYPHPRAQFEISPDKAILPIDEIRFVNYSTGANIYKWEFGDGNTSTESEPVHKYLKYGKYDVRLVAQSENGCSDTLVVKNAFSGSEYYINMPNAFIPNSQGPSGGTYTTKSDESAEIFHPSYSGVTDYQLRIFAAKTGILLFESNDINIGWDGYYKGQLCNPGVYIWKIRGNFSNGEPFTKMGDVTVLKN
ncbi:MAG TPA: PKD domain-containing protein [Bacteroidales bacterium]|nr:PKD domain-containing protein [Bacteroidales bacterium]